NVSRHAGDPVAVAHGAIIATSTVALSFSATLASASWKAEETRRALSWLSKPATVGSNGSMSAATDAGSPPIRSVTTLKYPRCDKRRILRADALAHKPIPPVPVGSPVPVLPGCALSASPMFPVHPNARPAAAMREKRVKFNVLPAIQQEMFHDET